MCLYLCTYSVSKYSSLRESSEMREWKVAVDVKAKRMLYASVHIDR